MSFWGELKRRNIFKVGAAYLIAAWLILQVASITFPALNLPVWALTLVTVILIIGLPLALIFTWAFELAPEGVKRSENVPLDESITNVTGKKLNYIVMGLLVVAVAYILFDNFYLDRRVVDTELASTAAEQAPAPTDVKEVSKTIAVLPFDDLSPEKDQEYFVLGLSEEILNSLAQISELNVTGKTSSFSFKGSNKTVQEISNVLGVEHVLEGSVRKAGNDLRITAQLLRAEDGFHLFSKTYDRRFEDIFAVQEDIAATVANELKITLGIEGLHRKVGSTWNVEAYEMYLTALGQHTSPAKDVMIRTLELLDAAIELDPEFAGAWAAKAFIHTAALISGPIEKVDDERSESLRAALKAVEVEPNFAAGHFQLGWVKTINGDWIEAEKTYRRAFELTNDPFSYEITAFALHYFALGYFEKSLDFIENILEKNPYNQNMRAFHMLNLHILGDTQEAKREYQRSMAMFDDEWFWGTAFSIFIRFGSDSAISIEDISDILTSGIIWNLMKENLDSPKEALQELHRAFDDSGNLTSWDFMEISLWSAYFGDFEFALRALEKNTNITAQSIILAWLPIMKEVRQLPRFKEYIRGSGLVDYWNQFGWPDICHPLDNGDFVCE